jgi:hypothetical protein
VELSVHVGVTEKGGSEAVMVPCEVKARGVEKGQTDEDVDMIIP